MRAVSVSEEEFALCGGFFIFKNCNSSGCEFMSSPTCTNRMTVIDMFLILA